MSGEEAWLVIVVPPDGAGEVHVSFGDLRWTLTPEDVSKLRRYYLEAQARALSDRGHW